MRLPSPLGREMNRDNAEITSTLRRVFNFTVDHFPLSGPEGLRTPWCGLFRSDTGEAVGAGSVDRNYVPHTTEDVVALVEAAATAFGGAANLLCAFSDGHFVIAEPSQEHRYKVYDDGRSGGDGIWPRLIISAPYGEAGSFEAAVGYYRDVCRNLTRLRSVPDSAVQIPRTRSLCRRPEELVASLSCLRSGWENLRSAVMRMTARQVNWGEFVRAVYGDQDDEPTTSTSLRGTRLEQTTQRLEFDRGRTGQGGIGPKGMVSAWDAFNTIQWYAQHAVERPGDPANADRIRLALDDPAVIRAEELAAGGL